MDRVGHPVFGTIEGAARQRSRVALIIAHQLLLIYRISANSFRGNYSFLNLTLCTVTFGCSTYRCGNYLREETIQGRKLFAEIRYSKSSKIAKYFHFRITAKNAKENIVRISCANKFFRSIREDWTKTKIAFDICHLYVDMKSYFGCNISLPLDRPTNGVQMVVVKATIISTLLA